MGELRNAIVRIKASPRLITTGLVVDVYIAGGGDRSPYIFGGQDYKAGVADLPRFRAEVDWKDEGWTGGVVPQTGVIAWSPTRAADYLAFPRDYVWRNATILVEVGEEGEGGAAPATWTTVLNGTIAGISATDGVIDFTVADLSVRVDKPVVTARFAGTGGIEGPIEAKERAKRRSWGTVFNVDARIIDKVNSIYEFGDPAFQATSVSAVKDMGRAASPAPTTVVWQGTVAATFTALQGATAVQGSGVVAPSIQCVKWWTTPAGPLTVDFIGEGGDQSAPKIATTILTALAPTIAWTVADRDAAHTLRPDAAGVHVDDVGQTIAQTLDQLLSGVSMLWVLDAAGAVKFREITFSSPVETVTSQQVSRVRVFPHHKTRRVGYKRNNRVHADGEIATTLKDRWIDTKFIRQNATPATPTGDAPAGWTDGVPAGTSTLWQTQGTKDGTNALIGVWSTPQALTTLVPRGAHSTASVLYYANNIVTFGGGSYIAVSDHTSSAGNQPSGTSAGNATWDVLAAPGTISITGYLTNQTHIISAASDGTGYILPGTSGGTFVVLYGTTDVTGSSSTYDITGAPARTDTGTTFTQTKNGLTLTLTKATGVYALSGASWTTDSETFTLTALYSGTTITLTYKLTKSKAGAAGSGVSAKMIFLASTHQTFTYAAGATVPNTQTTTLNVTRQNTTQTTTWEVYKADGTTLVTPNSVNFITIGATPFDSATIDQTQFDYFCDTYTTTGMVVLTKFTDGSVFSDKISIVKVQDGAAGQTGQTGQTGATGNYRQTVYKRSLTVPATPVGNGPVPAGWATSPPADDGTVLWVSTSELTNANVLVGSWSVPIRADSIGIGSWSPIHKNANTISTAPGTIKKAAGGALWTDAGFYSTERYIGSSVAVFKAPALIDAALGVDTAPGTLDKIHLDYAFILQVGGGLLVHEIDVLKYTGTYVAGDRFTIAIADGVVRYYKNAAVVYTSAAAPSATVAYALDGEIYTLNGALTDIGFIATGSTGNRPEIIYIRQLATPAAPTGDSPAGWSTTIPAGADTLWQSNGTKNGNGNLVGSWSAPQAISAETPRGAWLDATAYYVNNTVTYSGGTYKATVQHTSSSTIKPSGTDQANGYWDVVAAPGAAAPSGTGDLGTSVVRAAVNVTVSTSGQNLRTLANAAGYAGGHAYIDFTTNGNVTGSPGASTGSAGGHGIDSGSWPAGKTISLKLTNAAGFTVKGGGGGGGSGGDGTGAGTVGGASGHAINLQIGFDQGIANAGTIQGGGGGGGGGGGRNELVGGTWFPLQGGGGGGGYPNGIGGTGYASGTTSAGSVGGAGGAGEVGDAASAGAGGAGGNVIVAGTSGSAATGAGGAGGAAGNAVKKNGFVATVTTTGTTTGTVG